jgi:hypothetical protein
VPGSWNERLSCQACSVCYIKKKTRPVSSTSRPIPFLFSNLLLTNHSQTPLDTPNLQAEARKVAMDILRDSNRPQSPANFDSSNLPNSPTTLGLRPSKSARFNSPLDITTSNINDASPLRGRSESGTVNGNSCLDGSWSPTRSEDDANMTQDDKILPNDLKNQRHSDDLVDYILGRTGTTDSKSLNDSSTSSSDRSNSVLGARSLRSLASTDSKKGTTGDGKRKPGK